MKLAALVLVLATSIDCFDPPFLYDEVHITGYTSKESDFPFSKIVNGHEVEPHSIPYQVYILAILEKSLASCGGFLITQKFVMTAAHCIVSAVRIKVTLGVHDLKVANSEQKTVMAEKWSYHRKYIGPGGEFHNDIAVIELSEKINLTDAIGLARIPSPSDDFDVVGKKARVSGWGKTSGDGETSDKLRAVNNTIISLRECRRHYDELINSQICFAAKGGRTSCSGDSGGPLVVENTVVGIVSFGSEDCLRHPAVMTKVSSFLKWIQKNTDWVPT